MFTETMSVEDVFGLFLLAFMFVGVLLMMFANDGRKYK